MSTTEEFADKMRTLAAAAAEARGNREYLEEFKRSKLAMLMATAERDGATSIAAQERDARRHPEYLALLDGLREAVEICERCEYEVRIGFKVAEMWQTKQANERAERRVYGA